MTTTTTAPRTATATKTILGWATVCKAEGHIIEIAATREDARQFAREIETCDDCTAETNATDEQEILEAEETEGTQDEILAQITEAASAGDIEARNAKIREARDLLIRRVDIATAAGVSVNYLQHILNPQPRVRVEQTKIATADLEILLAASRSLHAIDEGLRESLRSLDPEVHARLGEILSTH